MRKLNIDWLLITPIIFLLILSLTILTSVASHLVFQQGVIMLIGIGIASLVALTDYRILKNFSGIIYALAIILLVTTYIIGQTTRGSVRWIPLGSFQIQTSEAVKPLLIIFFASLGSKLNFSKLKSILNSFLLFSLPAFLIFRQPDLGSTLVVISLWLGIVFASGLPIKYALFSIVLSVAVTPLSWGFLKEYQKLRLITFINPLADPLKSGYNLIQSIVAVGSGQIFGKGLGQGTQSQLKFLPEHHTDFIFASLAEELGFVGSVLLLSLFTLLFFKILKTAQNSSDRFGYLICIGVFSMLTFQTFINIGMNIGLVPITGITLPLISFGGSSLISTLSSLGLVISVSMRRPKHKLFEIH